MFHVEHMLFILYLFFLIISGCSKPNLQVYQEDEIYKDLKKNYEAFSRESAAEANKAEDLGLQIKNSQPQTGQAVAFIRQKDDASLKSQKLAQKSEFYRLRMISREKSVIKAYLKKFNSHEPYESNEDYASYKEIEKLVSASKNWNDRVPKLRSPAEAQKKAKTKEENKKAQHE